MRWARCRIKRKREKGLVLSFEEILVIAKWSQTIQRVNKILLNIYGGFIFVFVTKCFLGQRLFSLFKSFQLISLKNNTQTNKSNLWSILVSWPPYCDFCFN